MLAKYPYLEKKSKIFGRIKRPLVPIQVLKQISKKSRDWLDVDGVLADTGADITLFPRFVGEMVVGDITAGKYIEIKGVVPSAVLVAFTHKMKLRVAGREIETMAGIADSNDIPPILGRFDALDLFNVEYRKGRETVFG